MLRLLLLLLVFALPASAETIRLGDRSYRIDLPARPQGAPLILALHGGGGCTRELACMAALSPEAVFAALERML